MVSVDKPIVFFSHSSQDKVPLIALKQRFVELTGGTIDVFLSSDGQSIRLGSNWVASIEQALQAAKIMFVFVSPNSLHSQWLYFETGHAYSKGISVVPVGLFGIDVGLLPPPMNLLQGFNVMDGEALNNLIATVNDEFRFAHRPGFAQADFELLNQRSGVAAATNLLGHHSTAVKEVQFEVANQGIELDPLDECLKNLHGFTRLVSTVLVSGAKVEFSSQLREVTAHVDPLAPLEVFDSIEKGFRLMKPQHESSTCPYQCNIVLEDHVTFEQEQYKQLSRLGPTVTVAGQRTPGRSDLLWLRWKSITFILTTGYIGNSLAYRRLQTQTTDASFRDAHLGELIDFLFERSILQYFER